MFIKKYFKNLSKDFGFDDKENLKLLAKCLVILIFQLLSFIYKPFVFVELLYVICLIIIEKRCNKIIYLIFLLPFYNVFRYGTTNTQYNQIFLNLGNVYFSVFLLFIYVCNYLTIYIIDLIKKRKTFKLKMFLIFLLLYIMLIFPINQDFSFSSFCVITALFVVLYLIFNYKEDIDIVKCSNFWLFGILLSIFVYCFKDVLPYMQDYIILLEGRYHFLQRDPNYYSLEILCLLLSFSVMYLKGYKKTSFPIIWCVLSLLGLLSGSKAFLLTYILYCIFFGSILIYDVVKYKKYLKWNKKWVIIVSSSIFIIVTILLIMFWGKFTNLIGRFFEFTKIEGSFEDKINKLTTNRYGIWKEYLFQIFLNFELLLFGAGAFSPYISVPIHNTFLQLFYFGGMLFIFVLIFLIIFYILKNKIKITMKNCLMLIILFIMSCSLDLLFSYRTYIILIFMVFVQMLEKAEESNECKQKEVER